MIVAGIASMPERINYLEKTVEALRPQVDVLRVYLNNFESVPGFLKPGEGVLSSEAEGDLGDSGKFYWFDRRDELNHDYYLTMDDDLGYPSNYVAALIEEFEARNGQAIIGVHGSTFLPRVSDFVDSRDQIYRFDAELKKSRSVHLLGTATTILSHRTIDRSLKDLSSLRNAADLHLGIAAQKQEIPMVVIARPANWITEERPWNEKGFSIWKSTKAPGNHNAQTELAINAVDTWQLFNDPFEQISRDVSNINSSKSLFSELEQVGSFDRAIEIVNNEKKGDLYFVVVGAMDGVGHDKLHRHIIANNSWRGMLVEPLPDMFEKLKTNYSNRSNLIFENVAITDKEGLADITRIPEKNVGEDCPQWADGISTLRPDIHIIGSDPNLKEYSVTEQIRTTTFATLAKKNRIADIDILQIDAEGFDKIVFDQIWAENFRPKLVKIEVNYLTYVSIKEVKTLLETYGYKCSFERDDLIAVR